MKGPPYQCAVCESQWFDTMEALRSHELEIHNPQESAEVSMRSAGGPFPCPECGVEMETPERLEEHIAAEHPERSGMGRPPFQEGRGSKGTFSG